MTELKPDARNPTAGDTVAPSDAGAVSMGTTPTAILPRHAPMSQWPVGNDCLIVGGIPLTLLAKRIGRTPFYAYDRRLITERVALLRHHLPDSIRLHYAMKANPMPAVVAHVGRMVDGIDIASAGELRVALDAGIDPGEISFAGPGKTDDELAAAVASRILVNVESPREIHALARISRETGTPARVAIRVNPDFELKASGMKMSGGPKQFGIDAETVPEALSEIGRRGLSFEGFHIFGGSQSLKAEAICEMQQKTLDLAIRLATYAPGPVRSLNIGGGFGIPYFPGEAPLDVERVGNHLRAIVDRARETLPQARLAVELGRYIVGEAGIYVCRILDRKVSRGEVFLIVDGGLHHHLAASGNFGQVIRKNYPACIGNRVTGSLREIASVVGPLCTPLDVLAGRMELAKAAPGDLVAIFQSGAYGATASPQRFLSHPACAEALV
jgi:diaminopimelate decarboxylase